MDNKTEQFLEYRNLLFSIAYNMLGSIDAAQDMVQDTFLKWTETDISQVRSSKAFLVKMITNRCINHLNSASVQREQYIGIWLPEPLQNQDSANPLLKIESYQALSIGMLVLMQKLSPQERAIFLLKEIFSYDYQELAEIFDKTNDNCRQIFKRAKAHLGNDAKRFEVDMRVYEKILQNFLLAIEEGSLKNLIQLLKEDIHLFADGAGKTIAVNGQRLTAFRKPISGRDQVGRLLLGVIPKFHAFVPEFSQHITFANGLPSIVSYSGNTAMSVVSLEPEGDCIRNIYVQVNPDKLRHFNK